MIQLVGADSQKVRHKSMTVGSSISAYHTMIPYLGIYSLSGPGYDDQSVNRFDTHPIDIYAFSNVVKNTT
jgi:hypothetical protein